MIQIITKGKLQKYKTTCPECETVFTYEKVDIEPSFVFGNNVVECPLCRTMVEVSMKDEIKENESGRSET